MTPMKPRQQTDPKRAIRLGLSGERTPDTVLLAGQRAAFLAIIETEVPAVLADLARLAQDGRVAAPDLEAWARRWSLCSSAGTAADWVLEAARETLELWLRYPTLTKRTWQLPDGGAWWMDDPQVPERRGAALYREDRPLRWLAQYQCARWTYAEIAAESDPDARPGESQGEYHARRSREADTIRQQIREQAATLGLARRNSPRGRPRKP